MNGETVPDNPADTAVPHLMPAGCTAAAAAVDADPATNAGAPCTYRGTCAWYPPATRESTRRSLLLRLAGPRFLPRRLSNGRTPFRRLSQTYLPTYLR